MGGVGAPLVSLAVGNRPHYFKESLESWRAVDGIENARFLFSCEPNSLECIELARTIDFAELVAVVVNPAVWGGPRNQLAANQRASQQGAAWWVHCEDDVVVAPDILSYFSWAADQYRSDPAVGWVTANTHRLGNGPAGLHPKGVFKGNVMTLCWATWEDRWPVFERHWDTRFSRPTDAEWDEIERSGWVGKRGKGWDWYWTFHLMPVHGLVAVKPCLSRVKHIGVEGRHSTPELYQRTVTDCFIGDLGAELELFDWRTEPWREVDPHFVEQWV